MLFWKSKNRIKLKKIDLKRIFEKEFKTNIYFDIIYKNNWNQNIINQIWKEFGSKMDLKLNYKNYMNLKYYYPNSIQTYIKLDWGLGNKTRFKSKCSYAKFWWMHIITKKKHWMNYTINSITWGHGQEISYFHQRIRVLCNNNLPMIL